MLMKFLIILLIDHDTNFFRCVYEQIKTLNNFYYA